MTREEEKAADTVGAAFHDFFMATIRERRRQPDDDIISALVHVEKEGDRLSEREMLNMVRLLLDASNETTTNLIGNDMLALLRNPDQLQRLRDDPSLIEDAIDKLLRFDSPVQTGFQYALADGEVGGAPVRKGQILALSVGAANRDPAMFEDRDRLDVERQGISATCHSDAAVTHCIGAPLARLEARIAFGGDPGAVRLDTPARRACGFPARDRVEKTAVPTDRLRPDQTGYDATTIPRC